MFSQMRIKRRINTDCRNWSNMIECLLITVLRRLLSHIFRIEIFEGIWEI